MSKDEFEISLRRYLEQQPFRPFVVGLTDGRQVVVKQPPVAFCDGAAGFIDPADDALVNFSYDQVQTFGLAKQGASA